MWKPSPPHPTPGPPEPEKVWYCPLGVREPGPDQNPKDLRGGCGVLGSPKMGSWCCWWPATPLGCNLCRKAQLGKSSSGGSSTPVWVPLSWWWDLSIRGTIWIEEMVFFFEVKPSSSIWFTLMGSNSLGPSQAAVFHSHHLYVNLPFWYMAVGFGERLFLEAQWLISEISVSPFSVSKHTTPVPVSPPEAEWQSL